MTSAVVPTRTWDDAGKLLLRVTIAGLLLFHGISKVKGGVDWMSGMLEGAGLPTFIRYGVYLGEVIAPLFVLMGFLARPAALVIALNMTMAIFLALRDKFFTINPQGGGWAVELEMLFLLGAVAIFLLGSGRYALSRFQGRWD